MVTYLRNSSGGLTRVGFTKREGGGYSRTAGGSVTTEKGSINRERIIASRQQTANNNPNSSDAASIPGAIASTVGPGGEPAVIVSPRTPEQALVGDPSVVASSRNPGVYIGSSGERVTPVASTQTPFGGGVFVKTQEGPRQSTYNVSDKIRFSAASTPEGAFLARPGLRSAYDVGFFGTTDPASQVSGSLSSFGTRLSSSNAPGGNKNTAQFVVAPFGYAAGKTFTGVGNLGESYFEQKKELGSIGGGISYSADFLSIPLGSYLGGRFVSPVVGRAANAARGVGGGQVFTESLTALGVGAGVIGTVSVARGSQSKEVSRSITSPIAVPVSGLLGGVAEGVFSSPSFGLRTTKVALGKPKVVDQLGGSVGLGELGVPKSTVQSSIVSQGKIYYTYFGEKLPAVPVTSTKTFQLVKTESGIRTGKVYSDFSTTNPLTRKDIGFSDVSFAVNKGKTIVEVSPSGLSGRVTTQTSSRVIGVLPTGERVVASYGRSVPFEVDVFGRYNILRGERRASVSTEQSFKQGGSLSGFTDVVSSGSGDVLFSVGSKRFSSGSPTVSGEGVAGRISGGTRSPSTSAGIEFVRSRGLVPSVDRSGDLVPSFSVRRLNRAGSRQYSVIERPSSVGRVGRLYESSSPSRLSSLSSPFLDFGYAPVRGFGYLAGGSLSASSVSRLSSNRVSSRSSYVPSIVRLSSRSEVISAPSTRISQSNRLSSAYSTRLSSVQSSRLSTRGSSSATLSSLPAIPSIPSFPGLFGYKPSGGFDYNKSLRKTRTKTKYNYERSITANFFNIKNKARFSKVFTGLEIRG